MRPIPGTGTIFVGQSDSYRERKCADTIGTVLKYYYIFFSKIFGSNFIVQHSETVVV